MATFIVWLKDESEDLEKDLKDATCDIFTIQKSMSHFDRAMWRFEREPFLCSIKNKLIIILSRDMEPHLRSIAEKVELEKLGYDTYMIYVNTTLEVAQQRNQERDRILPPDLLEKSWKDVQKNLGSFQALFKNST